MIVMIKPVGQMLNPAIEAAKLRDAQASRGAQPVVAENSRATSAASASPSARMAAEGPPIDNARILKIKQAIADGNYPVDADKIAAKMLDLDLPFVRH
jgi:negative regulator of flagellin synthesis FlgM